LSNACLTMLLPGFVDSKASLLKIDSSLPLTHWHNFFAIYALSQISNYLK